MLIDFEKNNFCTSKDRVFAYKIICTLHICCSLAICVYICLYLILFMKHVSLSLIRECLSTLIVSSLYKLFWRVRLGCQHTIISFIGIKESGCVNFMPHRCKFDRMISILHHRAHMCSENDPVLCANVTLHEPPDKRLHLNVFLCLWNRPENEFF